MKKDTWSFLYLLKYYLVIIFRFDFKPYKINLIHFTTILHILQSIKCICYKNSKNSKKNMQI